MSGARGPVSGGSAVSYPSGKPKALYGMTPRAKRFYSKAVEIMQEAGTVQVVDGDVLSMYCSYLDKWLTNAAKLKKEGDIVNDWRGQPVKNPRFDVVLKTGQQVNAFASKLGFSPADRERIKARGPKEKSALQQFAEKYGG